MTGRDWALDDVGDDIAAGRLLSWVIREAFHFLQDILYKLTSSPLKAGTGAGKVRRSQMRSTYLGTCRKPLHSRAAGGMAGNTAEDGETMTLPLEKSECAAAALHPWAPQTSLGVLAHPLPPATQERGSPL